MPGESDRKKDHIRVVREEDVESGGTGFSDVFLEHEALPEINKKDIDTSVELFNHRLNAPIFIESMTGGHPKTKKINQSLAYAAQQTGVAMGVGSQRAGLEGESVGSYTIVREEAPDAFIYGNIGVAQLSEYGVEGVERAVEMIDADAMSIHLNFLQEAIQPEGDINAKGCLENIKTLSRELSVPLIVKETGNGISKSTAKKLADSDVDLLDVAGKGGTTWSGVEAKRAREKGEKIKEHLGELYSDWGIPTVVSVVETSSVHPKIVASGGIRSGLDIAKSISLGADFGGLAKPMLSPAVQGKKETKNTVERIVEELRTAMFITGSKDVEELSKVEAVVTGKTLDYITQI